MTEILEEQGFQLSGACNLDNECVIQVGRILGARKMIAGTVSKVGSVYTLQARIVDITTARIEHQALADHSQVEQLLLTGAQTVARELAQQAVAGMSQDPRLPSALHPTVITTGQIRVVSDPPGAIISLNGRVAGQAPATIVLQEGPHDLMLELEGFIPHSEKIEVVGGQSRTMTISLRHVPVGSVRVTSTPDGAQVYLDGDPVGATPVMLTDVTAGKHAIEISKEGFDSVTESVEIIAGAISGIDAALVRSGRADLVLRSTLTGARVFVDGQPQSTTLPVASIELRPGRHEVSVKAAGYSTWRKTVELDDGDQQVHTVLLRPKSPLLAASLSLITPGLGHFYQGRSVKGAAYLIAGVAAATYAGSAMKRYWDIEGEYRTLEIAYIRASTVDEVTAARLALSEKHDELSDSRARLLTSEIILGAIWTIGALDAALLMPRLQQSVMPAIRPSVSFDPSSGTLSLRLSLSF
ncbi:PEGA domain-containing protein [Gemmatimonadota bacterium]